MQTHIKITIILLAAALATASITHVDRFSYLDFFEYCTALGYPV
jgi:hypothetical protein